MMKTLTFVKIATMNEKGQKKIVRGEYTMKKYYIDLRFESEGSYEGEALENLEEKLPDNLVYYLSKITEVKK